MKRLILVDGNSLMYRAYFGMAAMGNLKANSKGVYTNAIHSFARMIDMLTNSEYDNILVAFDAGKKTFRHELVSEYKDGRSSMPDELRMQVAHIKELLRHMNIAQYELPLYEADDIIGTLCKQGIEKGYHVDIYSSDKDLLQLISDDSTVHLTKKGMTELEDYTRETFREKYQLEVEQFIDLKALMGDKSDNLAGIPGIGEKKAQKLLQEYKSVEGLIENKDSIKGADGEKIRTYYNDAIICKKMVTILQEAPIEIKFEDTVRKEKDYAKLKEFYEYLELNSLLKDLTLKVKVERKALDYKVIDNVVDLKSILVPYSAIVIEALEGNYHKNEILAIALKNHLGDFIIKKELLNESIDLKLFLSDKDNHKCTYDYKKTVVMFNKLGIDFAGVDFDLLLATYILNPSISKSEFKVIANYYNYNDVLYEEEVYGKGAKIHIPSDDLLYEHALKKANCIYILKKSIKEKLENNEQLSLLVDMEIPLSKVLAEMEYTGLKVDLDELNKQALELNTRIKNIEKEIYYLAGEEFNISSPKQLGVILFEKLQLDSSKKTKTGYSTNIEVLEQLIDKHDIIRFIIDYRQLTKLYSTYIEGIRESLFEDNKVHTIYEQALTQTGRLSSIEPNLQNIPIKTNEGKNIRKIFIPEEGYSFFSADYSQIELRVLAHMAGVSKLIDAFNNNEDIHTKTAQEIFNKEYITPLDRRKAKAVNFGIIYGISAFGLASDVGITNVEASNYIKRYYEVYPEIKDFMDETIEYAKENQYVKTIKNRIRLIPDINSPMYQLREFAKRTAMNAPIQGSAADIIKIAMIKIDEALEEKKLKSHLLLQVHDELILEVYKGEEEIVQELVIDLMQNCVKLDVPLMVEYSFGNNWYEVK